MEPVTMTENSKIEAEGEREPDPSFKLISLEGRGYKVSEGYYLGDSTKEVYCIRHDPADKHIAAACGDGTIRIYNLTS